MRDWSLFRGGAGLVQIGEGSMIFMQGKGGYINLCTHIRELCYTKGKRGEGLAKNVLHKGEGQENFNMATLHLHQPSPPSK